MADIHFIGREKELNELKDISKGNFFLILKGRRRIGKTSLLRKAFPNAIYLFIWPDKSIDWILEQLSSEYQLPRFKNFGSLLEYLLDLDKVVILDEFQNFLNIDKSIYGEVQEIIDRRKLEKKAFKLAVAGSSHSLMNRVFYDSASPLYGRKTHEIDLRNLDASALFSELKIPLTEFIDLWSVFEGVPYYYELIDLKKKARENIFSLVLSRDSQLRDEGKAILSVEFGKDSRTYNTVLTAISEGKTKLNEISSLFDNKKTETMKYIDILRKEFNLVRKVTPLTENPKKSRTGKYEINDNFLSFWFYFYDKNRSYVEQERFEELKSFFNDQFNGYVGRKFEKFIITLIRNGKISFGAKFNSIGSQWGKSEDGTYEIDVMAINSKGILLGECKWSDDVNSLEVLNDLDKKLENIDKRGKYLILCIFAKSFSKKIEEFNGNLVHCYDLKDIEKFLRKK